MVSLMVVVPLVLLLFFFVLLLPSCCSPASPPSALSLLPAPAPAATTTTDFLGELARFDDAEAAAGLRTALRCSGIRVCRCFLVVPVLLLLVLLLLVGFGMSVAEHPAVPLVPPAMASSIMTYPTAPCVQFCSRANADAICVVVWYYPVVAARLLRCSPSNVRLSSLLHYCCSCSSLRQLNVQQKGKERWGLCWNRSSLRDDNRNRPRVPNL